MSMPNVGEVLSGLARRLADNGVETPRNDAKMLMAEAYGVVTGDIEKLALLDGALPDGGSGDQYWSLMTMVERRCKREPLQYIVGRAPFRYLDLDVGPGVFIPRPETETVVQAAIDWLTRERISPSRVVDLCAGSGAIGLSMVTEVPGSEVWAIEQSKEALVWAKRNMDKVFGRDSLAGYHYHLFQGDATSLATLRRLDGSVDVVVSNPPYVPLDQVPEQPEVRDHDPKTALYGGSADGTFIPERILLRAVRLLKSGGALVMEHDVSQGQALVDFARANGFAQARTGDDLTGRPRYLFAVKE